MQARKRSQTLPFKTKCREVKEILEKVPQTSKGLIQVVLGQKQKLIECKWISWRGGRAGDLVDGNWANSLKRAKAISDPATNKTTISGSIFLIFSEVYPG